MTQNLYSLGLLRNGKVYANKALAIQGLTQSATNDGVAKLARYLYTPENSNEAIIRTLVGFYANADEMEDNGGGQSSYTILDIEGSAADVAHLQEEINTINGLIGDGIDGKTLTQAINEANEAIAQEVSDREDAIDALEEAIDALKDALIDALTISLEVAGEPTSGYLKTYILSQGIGSGKTEIGRIDIPKDMVVSGGSLVHGTWDGDTFTEDPDGPDTAIKIEFANADTIYINTKDLVDFYTAGNAAIDIDNAHNTISLKLDRNGEAFLTISEDGLKLDGVQTAIDTKVEEVADRERLEGSDGISIASNKVKAVAAEYSAPAIKNPITVDKNGIKFSSMLDCGFYDSDVKVANDAADIAAIADPSDTDLFITSEEAVEALALGNGKTFKNLAVEGAAVDTNVELLASENIEIDGLDVSGGKGSSNGKIHFSAPEVSVKSIDVENGSTVYNVFEGGQKATTAPLEVFNASDVTVDNPSLAHNVFNIYKSANDAVINISDSSFNLNVDNSNVLRLSNIGDSTGVTVNFENVDWTYKNSPEGADFGWAGLVIFQPYTSNDASKSGDVSKISTWTFNFKNCKYNGVKVTANNFGEENQVVYLYSIGNTGAITDPEGTFTMNFE